MADAHGHGDGSLMLNGISIDQGAEKLLHLYDPKVMYERQESIGKNRSGLESLVKDIMGDSTKASDHQADSIIRKLAYEIAKTEGMHGKSHSDKDYDAAVASMSEEDVLKYIKTAGDGLGDPRIGNLTELKKAIVNMASARPGSIAYSQESELGRLINYIATQSNEGQKEITYLSQRFQEKWTSPKHGLAAQDAIGSRIGFNFNGTATASDALGHVNNEAQVKLQQYIQQTGKTYGSPKPSGSESVH